MLNIVITTNQARETILVMSSALVAKAD